MGEGEIKQEKSKTKQTAHGGRGSGKGENTAPSLLGIRGVSTGGVATPGHDDIFT